MSKKSIFEIVLLLLQNKASKKLKQQERKTTHADKNAPLNVQQSKYIETAAGATDLARRDE